MKSVKLSIVAIIAAFVITGCNSQKDGYTIKGEVADGMNVDTVAVYADMSFSEPIAFGVVKDNKFTIKGEKVDTIRQAYIGSKQTGIFNSLVLENNQTYTCKLTPENIIVRGGRIHEMVYGKMADGEGAKLNAEYEELMKRAKAISQNDLEAMNKIEEEMMTFGMRRAKFYNAYTEPIISGDYPVEAKVLALMMNSDGEKYPQEKRLEMITEYEKAIGANHPLLEGYRQQVEFLQEQQKMEATVSIGSDFKPVVAPDRNGKEINLADVVAKNEYTLLEFWASWCSPCRAEIPNLEAAYEKYKSKGFEIFSVSLDEKQEDWLKAMDKEKTPWINVIDPKGFQSEISRSYGIMGIPAGFLISKDGKIVESNEALRGGSLHKLLDELLR